MSALVFLDTETTGLSLDDDIWEFAAIRREPDGREETCHLFIHHDTDKCVRLPKEFRDDHRKRYPGNVGAYTPREAAERIAKLFGDDRPHVVGAVPNFDTERLHVLLSEWDVLGPDLPWHYHLIDVEALAVGYLSGLAREYPGSRAADVLAKGLPWDSDAVAGAVGVEITDEDRHTALGDARWAMRIYDAVMGDVTRSADQGEAPGSRNT
jgi:Exonuclease